MLLEFEPGVIVMLTFFVSVEHGHGDEACFEGLFEPLFCLREAISLVADEDIAHEAM